MTRGKTESYPVVSLKTLRESLQQFTTDPGARPFLCDGSPLGCQVFIVGFNPATEMDQLFWSYWSDTTGLNKSAFMRDYLIKRGLRAPKGARARIERIVRQLPRGTCLETNICSKPTRTAAELASADRTTAAFRFLLRVIKPRFIYAHSNEPIEYLRQLSGVDGFDKGAPRTAGIDSKEVLLLGTRGPLFRMGFSAAEEIGCVIRSYITAR